MGKYVEVYVEDEDILESLDDYDLIEEMKARKLTVEGSVPEKMEHIITAIWLKRRVGVDYQKEIDDLIYEAIGKIV